MASNAYGSDTSFSGMLGRTPGVMGGTAQRRRRPAGAGGMAPDDGGGMVPQEGAQPPRQQPDLSRRVQQQVQPQQTFAQMQASGQARPAPPPAAQAPPQMMGQPLAARVQQQMTMGGPAVNRQSPTAQMTTQAMGTHFTGAPVYNSDNALPGGGTVNMPPIGSDIDFSDWNHGTMPAIPGYAPDPGLPMETSQTPGGPHSYPGSTGVGPTGAPIYPSGTTVAPPSGFGGYASYGTAHDPMHPSWSQKEYGDASASAQKRLYDSLFGSGSNEDWWGSVDDFSLTTAVQGMNDPAHYQDTLDKLNRGEPLSREEELALLRASGYGGNVEATSGGGYTFNRNSRGPNYQPQATRGETALATDAPGGMAGGGQANASSDPKSQVQSALDAILKNPSPYSTDSMQELQKLLTGNITQQYGASRKKLTEDMARRGIYDSSIAGGYYGDLQGQEDNALANMTAQLLQDDANLTQQGRLGGLNAAMGYQSNLFGQGLSEGELTGTYKGQKTLGSQSLALQDWINRQNVDIARSGQSGITNTGGQTLDAKRLGIDERLANNQNFMQVISALAPYLGYYMNGGSLQIPTSGSH